MHFTQFPYSPMNLNPALAGNFDGAYRLVYNQRRQWRSITPNPFSTIGISADAHQPLNLTNAGAGLSIYNDRAGASRLNTLQINFAGAYSVPIDSNQTVTFGVQPGITFKSVNYSKLSFDNQYQGNQYDSDAATGESFGRDNYSYPNLNAGVQWGYEKEKRKTFTAGVAFFNLLTPDQSLIQTETIPLDRRLSLNVGSNYRLTEELDILPTLLYMRQGTFNQTSLGTSVKYYLDPSPYHYRAIYLGGWWRVGDAGNLAIGMDYNRLFASVSYDINYSGLDIASRNRGGWEVAIIYIFRDLLPPRKRYKNCPTFI